MQTLRMARTRRSLRRRRRNQNRRPARPARAGRVRSRLHVPRELAAGAKPRSGLVAVRHCSRPSTRSKQPFLPRHRRRRLRVPLNRSTMTMRCPLSLRPLPDRRPQRGHRRLRQRIPPLPSRSRPPPPRRLRAQARTPICRPVPRPCPICRLPHPRQHPTSPRPTSARRPSPRAPSRGRSCGRWSMRGAIRRAWSSLRSTRRNLGACG